MPKKETKDMLIRAVDIDLWERIDRYCRHQGLKRREFLERTIDYFEGEDGGKISVEKRTRARGDEILANIKAYEMIIGLKKKIMKIQNNIDIMGDENVEMNMFMDLKRYEEDLDQMIKEYVPKHDIPDDPKAREKLGLPDKYCGQWYDLTYEQSLKRNMDGFGSNNQNNDATDSDGHPPGVDVGMSVEELEAEIKKLSHKQNRADTHEDEMNADNHQRDEVRDTGDRGDGPAIRHTEDVDVYELNRSRRDG